MNNQTVMITGATSGIGAVAALELARKGARVVGVGRNPEKCAAAASRIAKETDNLNVEYLVADLSSQDQIHRLAEAFKAKYSRLDVLVNNAGAFFSKRQESVDGIEMTLALNHLNYFLLTNLLLDTLKASAPARIINVSSNAHMGTQINFADIESRRRYISWTAYAQSKLANVLFTYELARRLEGTGVTANALHPGFVATGFGQNNHDLVGWGTRIVQRIAARSPEQGARTIIYLASSAEVDQVSGKYFVDEKEARSSPASYDADTALHLWDLSAG
ncbi:MAG: short-chain dehydrogenase/reductase, partial [Chloroflexi bacterium]|nr:short-chain dehydrogenase/reductase [Chloroflexota bacterium]